MKTDKKTSQWWISLYNSLFILTSSKEVLNELESETFEIMDELEANLDNGINSSSIHFYLENGWINHEQSKKLIKFKVHLDKFLPEEWEVDLMFKTEDWNLVRSWAMQIFQDLGLEDNGWNSHGEELIVL